MLFETMNKKIIQNKAMENCRFFKKNRTNNHNAAFSKIAFRNSKIYHKFLLISLFKVLIFGHFLSLYDILSAYLTLSVYR